MRVPSCRRHTPKYSKNRPRCHDSVPRHDVSTARHRVGTERGRRESAGVARVCPPVCRRARQRAADGLARGAERHARSLERTRRAGRCADLRVWVRNRRWARTVGRAAGVAATGERRWGAPRPRRLHHHERACRSRRDACAGGLAGDDGRGRRTPIDPASARPAGGGAGGRNRLGDRPGCPEGAGKRSAAVPGIGRFRVTQARPARHGLWESALARELRQFRRGERRGAPAPARRPDDLHPDRRVDQPGQQRWTAGRRRRSRRGDQHLHPLAVGWK